MPDCFWLRKTQFERIKPYFPLSHGVPRVYNRPGATPCALRSTNLSLAGLG